MNAKIDKKIKIVAKKLFYPELENPEFDELVENNPQYEKLLDELSSEENYLRRKKIAKNINVKKEINKIVGRKSNRILHGVRVAASLLIPILLATYLMMEPSSKKQSIHFDMMVELQHSANREITLVTSNGQQVNLEKTTQNSMERIEGVDVTIDSSIIHYSKIDQSLNILTKQHKLMIPKGKQFSLTLSDGTKVWLNDKSELSYPIHFEHSNREVTLVGEAYFEVAYDAKHPFIVNLCNGDKVQVFGTSFNIKAYDERIIQTTLLTGKVGVTTQEQFIMLAPSEQITVREEKEPTVETINTYDYVAWRDGWLIFNAEPLHEVLEVLSRCYDLDFELADEQLKHKLVQAKVRRFENYQVMFDMMEKSLNIKFEQTKNKITVKSK